MKKIVFTIIDKLGYRITNRKKEKANEVALLAKFGKVDHFDLLFSSRKFVHKIAKLYPDLKISDLENGLILQFNNLKIYTETPEEVFIVSEVFVDCDYNFFSQKPTTVIDIGTNIGIASLFFSTLSHVDNIYCFEPVSNTFAVAQKNFALNNSKVISFENIGLGKNNRTETFLFDNYCKGNAGIRGKLSPSYKNNPNLVEVAVTIKDATEQIAKIIENTQNNIVVKMDCEGAEYEIMENLAQSQILKKIDILMIEWHDKGATELESILQNAGFNFFSKNLGPNSGLLYAYRK